MKLNKAERFAGCQHLDLLGCLKLAGAKLRTLQHERGQLRVPVFFFGNVSEEVHVLEKKIPCVIIMVRVGYVGLAYEDLCRGRNLFSWEVHGGYG